VKLFGKKKTCAEAEHIWVRQPLVGAKVLESTRYAYLSLDGDWYICAHCGERKFEMKPESKPEWKLQYNYS